MTISKWFIPTMSQFFDAQRRFNEGKLYGNHGMDGYVRDMLKQYGDGGRKMQLPTRDDAAFENAMQYRQREKSYYHKLEEEVQQLRAANQDLLARGMRFATFINDHFPSEDDNNDAPVVGRDQRGGDTDVGRRGDRVLPAVQGDAAPREAAKEAASISNNCAVTTSDGDATRGSTADHGDRISLPETRIEELGDAEQEAAAPGRGAAGAAEEHVGGQGGEHGTA